MFDRNSKTHFAPICNFVPGYAFYNGLGYSLAGQLVNLVEWFIGLRK